MDAEWFVTKRIGYGAASGVESHPFANSAKGWATRRMLKQGFLFALRLASGKTLKPPHRAGDPGKVVP